MNLTTDNRYLEPNPLTVQLDFPFGPCGVKVWARNRSYAIVKRAVAPDLSYLPCVGHNNIAIVGLPRTGKSNIINTIFDMLDSTYLPEDLSKTFSNSMAYNLMQIKDVPYNCLAADDAGRHQDSYTAISKQTRELSYDFFDIRHLVENYCQRYSHAYILTIFSFHIFKLLAKRLRQADLLFFTSTFTDEEENKFLKWLLTPDHFEFLEKKMNYISMLNDYSFNRYSILKCHSGVFYCDFPIAKSNLKAKRIDSEIAVTRKIDIEIIEELEEKLPKNELYSILAFVYDPERDLKHIIPQEKHFIKILYRNGITQDTIAKLFHRHRNSISNIVRKSETNVSA